MTSLTGYIQGIGGGERRTVDKTGKEVKLSVFDNIDDVIVFNEAGETTQKTLTGKNKFNSSAITRDKALIWSNGSTYNQIGSWASDFIPVSSSQNLVANKLLSQVLAYDSSQSYVYVLTGHGWETPTGQAGAPINANTYFQIPSGVSYIRISRRKTDIGDVTIDDDIADFQIELGTQATDYEPYCGGVPSPNPDYPQDIKGIGVKQLDGTYKVSIDYYDEREERDGRITASGLAYPLYEGDILDFANGKVIRANGYRVFDGTEAWGDYPSYNGYYMTISDMKTGSRMNGKSNSFVASFTAGHTDNTVWFGVLNNNIYLIEINISGVTNLATWKTWLSNNNVTVVYPLATPRNEYITITGGDISDIGTAVVEADGTLTVKYDKAEMAIRKYSAKPDWKKIGYTDTPQIILDAFDYSKRIYDTWTSAASYASKYRGDKEMKFFPDVDLTGATNYSAMFQESGIQFTEPLTIGDGSSTVIDSRWMFQTSPIEKIELTTSDPDQKVQITNIFSGCSNLKNAKLTLKASGSMQSAFADCKSLKRIEDGLDTADVTSLSEAFKGCSSLEYLYELDLSACTTCYRAFQNCTSLQSAPYLNNILQNANLAEMFLNCSSLKDLPFIRLSSASDLTNMFQGTGSNLDENSRKNLLWMLTGCTYSGTKTLAHLGFTASMYSAASWQSLSNYNEFVSEGWSIGYT